MAARRSTWRAESQGGDSGASMPAAEPEEILPRVQSLFDENSGAVHTPIIKDGRVRIGFMDFDISSPEYVLGGEFDIVPTPLSAIDKPARNLVILGEVFGHEVTVDTDFGDDFQRFSRTDAIEIAQRILDTLVSGDVHTNDTGHDFDPL